MTPEYSMGRGEGNFFAIEWACRGIDQRCEDCIRAFEDLVPSKTPIQCSTHATGLAGISFVDNDHFGICDVALE